MATLLFQKSCLEISVELLLWCISKSFSSLVKFGHEHSIRSLKHNRGCLSFHRTSPIMKLGWVIGTSNGEQFLSPLPHRHCCVLIYMIFSSGKHFLDNKGLIISDLNHLIPKKHLRNIQNNHIYALKKKRCMSWCGTSIIFSPMDI